MFPVHAGWVVKVPADRVQLPLPPSPPKETASKKDTREHVPAEAVCWIRTEFSSQIQLFLLIHNSGTWTQNQIPPHTEREFLGLVEAFQLRVEDSTPPTPNRK